TTMSWDRGSFVPTWITTAPSASTVVRNPRESPLPSAVPPYNGSSSYTQEFVIVQPYSSQVIRIEVGELEPGDYKFEVRGTAGIDFLTEYPLEFVDKTYSVFIQTDRQVYQPGTKVSFRAVVLNSELKPAAEVRDELLDIFITDGEGNRVKEWRKIEALRGVFTGELRLGNSPVFSKNIEVAEYIMPKFMVKIQAPKHVTFKENIISVNIEAKNKYGREVKGEATVSVYPTIYSGVIQPIFQNPVRKVLPIEGSASVDFDIDRDLALNDEYERTVIIDVVIEEQLTGRRQNNSVEVHIHKYDYQMDLVKTADYFKPGLAYTAYVKVINNDGSPISVDDTEVTIRHGYSRVDEVYEVNTHKLDKNGIITLQYITPVNITNTTALRIEFVLGRIQRPKVRLSPVPAAVSFSKIFLQASLETEKPIVNLDVEVIVNCTEPMRYINYVLMGRGDVLLSHTFHIDNQKKFKFHFTATHAMVPICHLIVYFVTKDGELIADALDIEVDGLLQNFVDIEMNTLESEPDLDVELTIRAHHNSYIGLLAIDENNANLRDGYDITTKTVTEDLKKYDAAMGTPYPHFKKSKFMWKPGSSNSYAAIYESGANLLTNSHVDRFQPTLEDIYLRPVFYGPSTIKPDRGLGLPIHSVTRPPLAGPYAFSRIPRPIWNKPKVYLTEDIAQTWLFTNFSSGYEGKTSIRRRIPSSLNTWSISAFSLDPLHGLGLVSAPKKLKVTKSFVVTVDLPYSVQREEILAVPVVVNNFMNQDVNVDVTLHNQGQDFEFAEISNEINAAKKIELYRRKKINVKKNSSAAVSFMIQPTKVGLVEIKATANSPKSQDVAVKQLLVQPGGETEYYTKSILVDLRATRNLESSINFTIPKNAIPDSTKIEVSAVGSFLAPAMVHLENLIRLPTDCGEQNLAQFMSNLIILQYLKSTRQLNPTIHNEAVRHLETSYQQQLTYRKPDGSFSPFGIRDTIGSVWLTSYVVLAFIEAKPFIYIQDKIIDEAIDWLLEVQGRNGSFYETGNVIYEDLQSRNGNSLPLTAFTVIALLEINQRNNPLVFNAVNKGLDYIARNIEEDESAYGLALCSYVLHLAKHASKQSAFNLLEVKSKSKGSMKWWSKDVSQNETKNPWHHLPRSIDIETTSYALLTFMELNLLEDSVPVLNWLLNQQNNLGGFTSSQDTVVGLQALYKLVLKLASPTNMQLEFEYGGEHKGKFNINKNNVMILLNTQINSEAREVNLTAQGTGLAVFKVSYQYNMNVTGPWPLFTLDPQVDKNSNRHHLQVSICAGFVSPNLTDSGESNMAVMEVSLPSGFTADRDSLPSLEVSQNVQKVETRNGLTKIILYFNNITRGEYCPTVSAFRTHKVAKQKPVPVIIYDYYDTSRRARVFYSGPKITLCDVCEGEDCGDICLAEASASRQGRERNKNETTPDSSMGVQITLWLLLFSSIIMIYR
ncbi:hypothetical protein NQ317_008000, partial [Molorchus minor]